MGRDDVGWGAWGHGPLPSALVFTAHDYMYKSVFNYHFSDSYFQNPDKKIYMHMQVGSSVEFILHDMVLEFKSQ